ncbi:hypothetical protein [Microvirga antarctica]|uniref:hypothetical protein n=1 Tax=Microvirga antarctica TaxID=2819233 RepID=UPI001B311F38|nr:hypothetical protein [Microvirga antarctica]
MSEIPENLRKLLPGKVSLEPSQGDNFAGIADAVGGRFWISGSALAGIGGMPAEKLLLLRRKMWEANQAGAALKVTSDYLAAELSPMPSFSRRVDDLLELMVSKAKPLTRTVSFEPGSDTTVEAGTIIGSEHEKELMFFLSYLQKRGFISISITNGVAFAGVQPEAFIYRESEQRQISSSTRAFVAMWFGGEMSAAWQDGLEPAIGDAGYEAFRIDKHEHVNRIDDEILAQIRTSRFLVADFTSEKDKPRGGVYFEAGFALGLNVPVIWTAHERMEKEIHFDTRQYNHIFWTDPADLREKLWNRIVRLLGIGPLKTP